MLEDRQAERQLADAAIETALECLRADGREPDHWESSELAYAIGANFRGAYRLAVVAAEKSMTPSDERDPSSAQGRDAEFSFGQLEQAFATVRAEPLRSVPHFGPIIFVGDASQLSVVNSCE